MLSTTALACGLLLDWIAAGRGGPSFVFRARPAADAAPAPARPGKKAPAAKLAKSHAPVPEKASARAEGGAARPAESGSGDTATAEPPSSGSIPGGPAPAAPKKKAAPSGKVAIVIDDMGNSLEPLDELVALGRPLSIAVLPFSRFADETARRAHERGIEVLLHLPLESLNGTDFEPYTEGIVRESMPADEVRAVVDGDLAEVPYIAGVNNHMGSRVTADAALMRLVLEPLRSRRLFFLDSLTSGRSVAYEEARRLGLRAAARDVFLDAESDVRPVSDRLAELFARARKAGHAVGIGHPFPDTLRALRSSLARLDALGLEIAPVSSLAR